MHDLHDADARWAQHQTPLEAVRQAFTLRQVPADIRSILDVGCGDGRITAVLPRRGPVLGCDRSRAGARRWTLPGPIASVDRLPFRDRGFDLVSILEVLEHLPAPLVRSAVDEAARVARRDVLVTVPLGDPIEAAQVVCGECDRVFHPWGHLHSFSPDELRRLSPSGFSIHAYDRLIYWERMPSRVVARLRRRLPSARICPVATVCPDYGHPVPRRGGSGGLHWALSLVDRALSPWPHRRGWQAVLFRRLDAR